MSLTSQLKLIEDDIIAVLTERSSRNDGNTGLPGILFQHEINTFLKEIFYESWMDENDWVMFLDELEKQSGVSIKSLSKDLQVGLKNGHSIEKQFELVRAGLL